MSDENTADLAAKLMMQSGGSLEIPRQFTFCELNENKRDVSKKNTDLKQNASNSSSDPHKNQKLGERSKLKAVLMNL
jgi:hypothetical protein